tara:strand:- start:158 stop:349 length:192 start_codon:yes stop_codon:yes gene_type:complete
MTTTIDEYKALLKAHDWTFEFSERSSVFQRGIEQKRTLQMLQPKLDPDYTIWNQFAPDFAKAR